MRPVLLVVRHEAEAVEEADAGAHNEEILREIGYDDAQIADLRAEGAV